MTIKFEPNIDPFKAIKEKFRFMIDNVESNPGPIENAIDSITFGSPSLGPEDEDYLRPIAQEVEIKLSPSIEDENKEIVQGVLHDFVHENTTFGVQAVAETSPSDSLASKNSLFGDSHCYYNLKLPLYEEHSKTVTESALPSFLVAAYHKREDTDYSAGLAGYEQTKLLIKQTNSIEAYPSHLNNSPTAFNYHGTYDVERNYYNACLEGNYIRDNSFSRISEHVFVSNWTKSLSNYSNRSFYHIPYGKRVVLPKTIDTEGTSIRRALSSLSMVDIFMKRSALDNMKSEAGVGLGKLIEGNVVTELLELISMENLTSEEYSLVDMQRFGLSLIDPDNSEIQVDGQTNFNLMEMFVEELKMGISEVYKETHIDMKGILFNREECHSEPIFYEIVKTRTSDSKVVQRLYFYDFPETGPSMPIRFWDTQMRYGTEYTYTYYMHCMNFGYTISIEDAIQMGSTIRFTYLMKPRPTMVRLMLGTTTGLIVEPPPRKPIVKFSNFVNINNKIKVTLENRTGIVTRNSLRTELETISDGDLGYKDKLSIYNGSQYPYYSNISSNGSFDIYRMETKPERLSDFDGHLVQSVSSNSDNIYSRKRIKKTSTVHYLEHGKKYYYLFRATTYQGNFSNPSPVYEVEKIKDSDETILKVRTIKYKKEDKPSYSMAFRKFLKLSFPEYHTSATVVDSNGFEIDSAYDADTMKLGEDGLPVNLWKHEKVDGSHIKLRIESKSTGKKIDFNLVFNYNQPKIN